MPEHDLTRSLGYSASPGLSKNLQQVLVDLIALQLAGKQAHWNVVGHNFRDLHLQLDEVVDAAREAADDVAERMRALNTVPDGRPTVIGQSASVPQFLVGEQDSAVVVEHITRAIRSAVATIREVHDDVDAEDPSTADILHGVMISLEKLAWMISAENRGH